MNKLVLCGNANTGKTTIFNRLSKSSERVGNFHGVTVDKKSKKIKINNSDYVLVDLPGIYSLNSYTLEEKISTEYIRNLTEQDIILYVVDISKLQRNLYLFLQLKEIGYNIILCINNTDKSNVEISYKKLGEILKTDYVIYSKNIKNDLEKIIKNKKRKLSLNYFNFLVKNFDDKTDLKTKFDFVNKLENDKINDKFGENFKYLVEERYNFIEKNIIKNCNFKVKNNTDNFMDNLLYGKYSSIIIFVLIISLIFYLTFSFFGEKVNGILQQIIYYLFDKMRVFLSENHVNIFLIKFITEGVFLGVSILVSFLPQLFILFLAISFLEESGYISRLCFIFDDFLSKFGLNGKSIFTLLMCFGCSTSACYQARTNQNEITKMKVSLITPYISCSAKIPVYLLIVNTFFKKYKFLVLVGIYTLGIVIAFIVLKMLNYFLPEQQEENFILEVPKLKFPRKNLIKSSLRQTKDFFIKVGSLILVFNCIVWIFINCNFKLMLVDDIKQSILYKFGELTSIIFKPIGLNSPSIVSTLICGIIAKEMIVSTMAMFNINSVSGEVNSLLLQETLLVSTSSVYFTPITAITFLVFTLLYCPCISNFLVIRNNNKKWANFGLLIQFIIAYLVTFLVYFSINLFKENLLAGIVVFLSLIITMILFYKISRNLKINHK